MKNTEMITVAGSFSKIVVDGQTVARMNYRTDGQCECRKDGISTIMPVVNAQEWLVAVAMTIALTN